MFVKSYGSRQVDDVFDRQLRDLRWTPIRFLNIGERACMPVGGQVGFASPRGEWFSFVTDHGKRYVFCVEDVISIHLHDCDTPMIIVSEATE